VNTIELGTIKEYLQNVIKELETISKYKSIKEVYRDGN
jgi:hypothetical protein